MFNIKNFINPNSEVVYHVKALLGVLNIHRENGKQDICIFSSRRSGSTLLMQMIYSQPGVNYVDQPMDPWRYNPYNKINRDIYKYKKFFMDKIHLNRLKKFFNDVVFKGKLKGFSQWNYFDNNYKFISDRLVIKILNALPLIDWFEENFNIKIIYLVRHPIPTSLSIIQRNWGNEAKSFLQNPYFIKKYLNKQKLNFSIKILENGTNLEKFVLEWCLNHFYTLSVFTNRKWLTITYEELVLRPRQIVDLICDYLDLPDREKMLEIIHTPSKTTSRQSKKDIIEKGPSFLINRWKNKIDENVESEAMNILEEFGIDTYKKGSTIPSTTLLHFGSIGDYR